MPSVKKAAIEKAIAKYTDPYLQMDFIKADAIRDIEINDKNVKVHIELGYPCAGYIDEQKKSLYELISNVSGVNAVEIVIGTRIISHVVQGGLKPLPGVKNIIAIASGKGGVGKSTTAVNLALALKKEGANVGILDADIYGPNQPQMLGAEEKPETKDGQRLEPVMSYGLQSMSVGYLIDAYTAMIWRGPIVTTVLQQLLNDTAWHDLDYLVIDLPPGTGDIALTMAQKVPVSGAVIITTPQDVALLDALKGLKMFEKVNVPVLGVIENMSVHICSKCGHIEHIFGEKGGENFAKEFNMDLLGTLPLDIRIRKEADSGKPTVVAEPESQIAKIYRDIARKLAAKLSLSAKDYSSRFPKIVIEND